jgi:alcohol dehydrogenase class IV
MPYVMAWNAPAIQPELVEIAGAMGLSRADDVIPELAALFRRIGIPATLHDLGLAADKIDWVAEQSLGIARLMQNNPRPMTPADMRRLLHAAYTGDLAFASD